MSEKTEVMWRTALDLVVNSISAEHFREDLPWLREQGEDDPDVVGTLYAILLTNWFIESASLFAALQLPAEEVPAVLAEVRETLANLDFKKQRKRLERDERRYYDRFVQRAKSLFPELGEAMEALFNCYVAGDFDPETNPNDLITEALETAEKDLERAQHLIAQAGATALHSRPLWWRWQEEAYGPAASWLFVIANLVEDYTGGDPLGPLEEARADTQTSLQKVKKEVKEMVGGKAPVPPLPTPSPVDDLIEELIEQGEEPFAPEQLELCRAHREEAVLALMDLAGDEDLQTEDSPGEGHAPIHAVRLLGELRATEAVPTLIDVVAYSDPLEIIYNAAIQALEKIGPPALEPLLDFLRYSRDVETKTALAGAVAEAGPGDGRAYQALLDLWEEATWEDGKSLLAHHLAEIGGEQTIPLLQAALEDPDLDDFMDYNEVAAALEELGVEAPPPPADIAAPGFGPGLDRGAGDLPHLILSKISDPEHLMALVGTASAEWQSYPEGLAHIYADAQRDKVNSLIAIQTIILPLEVSLTVSNGLLEAVETLAFDAPTRGYPRWLRKTYTHLAECAGPDLRHQLTGVLLSLQHYLSEDYDVADDPHQLLLAARERLSDDEERRHLFGQAGALVLHGRPFWSLWPAETDPPLSGWLEGLNRFRRPLEHIGQIPLRHSPEMDPGELSDALLKMVSTQAGGEEPPPPAAKLLELLVSHNAGTLSPKQQRRFVQQRAVIMPHLIRMVEDKQYWYEDESGEGGWAAILAVRLLGELKATQAAETLVGAVADSQPEDIIHDAALFSLIAIGRPALSAVQAYCHYGRNVETKADLAEVLGRIGRRDKETFDLLRQAWEAADWTQNRRTVALAFGDLRDRRAIPLLQAALADRNADALDVAYVHWALQRLGVSAPLPERRSSRLRVPAPYNPRLIYDEAGIPRRLKYTVWGEPLCPDCGQPFVQDENGEWIHPSERLARRSTPAKKRRKRKRGHHR
jgi:HEAT repeat protein